LHRNWLLERLHDYAATCPGERPVIDKLTNFINAHDNCFSRGCVPGHVTGSAWLVDRAGQRTLLTHHRKLERWLQLGGHSDDDANTLRVALREAQEESGLPVEPVDDAIFDIDIHLIPARPDEPEHYHYDVRFLLRARDEAFVVTNESKALRWVAFDDVQQLTQEESVLRMVRKYQRLIATRPG
jgi:8-oxo-dGTP pyrophosphatase MutT (NUDIX family)